MTRFFAGMRVGLGVSVLLAFHLLPASFSVLWAQATAQIAGTIRDQSGAVLPGVQVTATQTATGLARSAITNETGSYVLPDLPVGPYRLEAALSGFRTFAQSGIVLQVGSNPVINVSLEAGQVAETVEVQADAALVETRATGIGQVIDNIRVMELPLAARNATIDHPFRCVRRRRRSKQSAELPHRYHFRWRRIEQRPDVLVGWRNAQRPVGNLNLPLPFPDALQEFKVETSSVPAQYGQHSAGAVNVVTKSGTNDFHGSLFEFVR